MIGDLTRFSNPEVQHASLEETPTLPTVGQSRTFPSFSLDDLDDSESDVPTLTKEQEDALLKVRGPTISFCLLGRSNTMSFHCQDSTGDFPDWITSFIRRVIQLFENLPEEGFNGTAGGNSEGETHHYPKKFRTLRCSAQSASDRCSNGRL